MPFHFCINYILFHLLQCLSWVLINNQNSKVASSSLKSYHGFWVELWCAFVLEPISLSLVCVCFSKKKKNRKHHFNSYIFVSQSIWSLHFGSNQFGPCYFQLALNLVPTVNSLTENAYVVDGLHSWHA